MPTITLLRHGQASFGAVDYDALSDLGRQQAIVAGRVLAARGLRSPHVMSGTLSRQVDTAAAVVDAMDDGALQPVDPRWNEYDHVGLVTGHPSAGDSAIRTDPLAFQTVLDRALAEWVTANAPGGWRTFNDGAIAALQDLAASLEAGQDAVVATSGGVIAAVCADVLGLDATGVVALNRVTVNAAFTTLLVGRSGINLLTFNDHAHLTGDQAHLRTYR